MCVSPLPTQVSAAVWPFTCILATARLLAGTHPRPPWTLSSGAVPRSTLNLLPPPLATPHPANRSAVCRAFNVREGEEEFQGVQETANNLPLSRSTRRRICLQSRRTHRRVCRPRRRCLDAATVGQRTVGHNFFGVALAQNIHPCILRPLLLGRTALLQLENLLGYPPSASDLAFAEPVLHHGPAPQTLVHALLYRNERTTSTDVFAASAKVSSRTLVRRWESQRLKGAGQELPWADALFCVPAFLPRPRTPADRRSHFLCPCTQCCRPT